MSEVNYKSGLKVLITKEGENSSPIVQKGTMVTADYIGYLEDGKVFSSSEKNGQVFQFKHGMGNVIPAWDEAFQGKKSGSEFTIITPPELAYGNTGSPDGSIPPDSILIFEIKLRGVQE